MPRSRFILAKWYLDAVDDRGNAFIGYAARLRWGALRVRYRSVLWSPADGAATARHTLRPTRPPMREPGEGIHWRCAPLHLDGRWEPDAPPIRRRLFRDAESSVVWDCVAPAARVSLSLGPRRLAGRGYVERLILRGRPWRLPIDRLRWGRFAAPGAALTWIDWEGPVPLRLVALDGVIHDDAILADDAITLPAAGRLTLAPPRSLRAGALGEVAAAVPGLVRRLPRSFRGAHESKRLCRAFWSSGPASIDGWAIHEVVEWRAPVPA